MEKMRVERGLPAPSYQSSAVNREHLGQRLFSSRLWMVYCILQVLASAALIVFVAVDLEEK